MNKRVVPSNLGPVTDIPQSSSSPKGLASARNVQDRTIQFGNEVPGRGVNQSQEGSIVVPRPRLKIPAGMGEHAESNMSPSRDYE
jgi:hypothetical protein